MPNPFTSAMGAVANPFVECLDVDGIVRRVDMNDVLNRVDVDELMDRIDWNAVLNKIDWNSQLERIDFNAVLNQIDLNEVVGRSDLGAIIAQSTSGVFSQVLDKLRIHLVMVDLILLRMKRCQLRRTHGGRLPPKPGIPRDTARCPKYKVDQAVAVQGRYCGFISKAVAISLDFLFITGTYALFLIFLQMLRVLFVGGTAADARATIGKQEEWAVVLYFFYWGLYFFLTVAATGATIGMAVVGLKVVRAQDGEDVSVAQAALRTLLLPVTTSFLPPLGVIGVYRRDGRMLHDLVANTGIIFEWEAQIAKVRALAMQRAKENASLRAASTLTQSTSVSVSTDEEETQNENENDNEDSPTTPLLDVENGIDDPSRGPHYTTFAA